MAEEKGDLLNAFYEKRLNTKYVQESEQEIGGKKAWAAYESSISDYEKTFAPFGEHAISDFLQERKNNNLPSVVIDVASGGGAVRELAEKGLISAGLSVGLSDPRDEKTKMNDQALGVDVVVGDFLQGKTWGEIKKWLSDHGRTTADLVMCRAIAGFFTSFSTGSNNNYEPLLYILAEKGLSITSPEGGMLLTDIPSNFQGNLKNIEGWVDEERSHTNYQIEFKPQKISELGNVLKIKK